MSTIKVDTIETRTGTGSVSLSNHLELTTGGLTINTVGQALGVGTNNPSHAIQVHHTAPEILLEETTTGGSKRISMGVASDGLPFISAEQTSGQIQVNLTGAEVARFNSNGLAFPSGKGIDFSAQTLSSNIVGNAKSELLDHYETGQFNADVTSSTGSGDVTIYLGNPENQASRYVRIGSLVTIFGSHVVQSWGNRTGDLRIANLPFPIWSGGGYGGGVSYFPADTTDNNATMAGGSSYVGFLKKNGSLAGGATDYWEISDLFTMKYLTYTFTYFTNIS